MFKEFPRYYSPVTLTGPKITASIRVYKYEIQHSKTSNWYESSMKN